MKGSHPPPRAIVEPLSGSAPPEAVFALTAARRDPAILETLQPAVNCGRFSIFASDPVDVFSASSSGNESSDSVIQRFSRRINEFPSLGAPAAEVPFPGGWIGFLSYEAGLLGQRVAPRSDGLATMPLARFGLYDHLLVFDHVHEQWFACAIDWPAGAGLMSPSVESRMELLRERLRCAESLRLGPPQTPAGSTPIANMTREAYFRKVAQAIDYIEAGDIYQVNLSQRFTVCTNASPIDLYRRLRRSNPASHAAFLSGDEGAILSSSPELFLDVRGGHVVTRPIKGTRPKSGHPVVDTARRRQLDASGKERAELTMIVDLLRNDLGRVCEFGSVQVTDPGCVEEHPSVFHRVATIEGRLSSSCRWPELLASAFPGGSITGAPKLRAMQIIRELEPTPREIYCGSIGWIGLDGNLSFNIAIRTMVQRGPTVHAWAGGAIVAESDPQQELEEIQAKAAGMFGALSIKQSRNRDSSLQRKPAVA